MIANYSRIHCRLWISGFAQIRSQLDSAEFSRH